MTGFSWLPDGLIPAADALLESLWLFGWLALGPSLYNAFDPIAKLPEPGLGLGWIWLLLALPALCGRLVDGYVRPSPAARRWLLLGVGLLAFALYMKIQALPGKTLPDWRFLGDMLFPWAVEPAARAPLATVYWLIGAGLLARGWWRAGIDEDEAHATRTFVTGAAAVLLLLLLSVGANPSGGQRAALVALAAGYFCFGLAWLGLVRITALKEQTLGAAGQFNWAWLGATVPGIAGLVIAAGVVGAAGGLALRAARAAGPLLWLAWPVLGQIVTAPARFLWFIVLEPLLRLLPRSLLLPPPQAASSAQPSATPSPSPAGPPATGIPHLAEWLALIVVLTLVIAVIAARLARRSQTGEAPELHPADVPVWSWRTFLGHLVRRRPARTAHPTAAPSTATGPAIVTVRQLYAAVLHWSGRHSHPRPPHTTPLEFEPELHRVLPPALAARITDAYVEVRYGERGEDPATAEDLLQAWIAEQAESP